MRVEKSERVGKMEPDSQSDLIKRIQFLWIFWLRIFRPLASSSLLFLFFFCPASFLPYPLLHLPFHSSGFLLETWWLLRYLLCDLAPFSFYISLNTRAEKFHSGLRKDSKSNYKFNAKYRLLIISHFLIPTLFHLPFRRNPIHSRIIADPRKKRMQSLKA